MKIVATLKIALPCILIGGLVGALVGGPMGDTLNGIRAGVIVGGAVAFFILQRKKSRTGGK